ncbi:hypothetical protein HMPREF0670_02201 [Prevotella sp. oral taxon 317 str. F0108]|nr:hypothetical protein HMPREF0670_02201 [Prevotella sp. oral taxon 317 str. F0108]
MLSSAFVESDIWENVVFMASLPELFSVKTHICVKKELNSPSVVNVLQLTSELNQFAQEPLAQIQATGNQGNVNTQESLAQLGEVSETLSTIYQHDINQIEEIFKQSAVVRTNWASLVILRYSLAVGDIYGIGRLPFLASLYRYFKSQSDFIILKVGNFHP